MPRQALVMAEAASTKRSKVMYLNVDVEECNPEVTNSFL
jgi:hypothetical protein